MKTEKHFFGLSILDMLFLIFTTIIMGFYLMTIPGNDYGYKPMLVFVLLYILIFIVKKIREERVWRWLTIAYPLIYLMGIFESFFMIIPWYNEKRYDQNFIDFDFQMFGVNPTIWMEQFQHPFLTDVLYFLYFLYFPLQFFILIYLYRKGAFRAMEKAIFVLMLCNFGAYICYFQFPAEGPRFFFDHLQRIKWEELNGMYISRTIRDTINMLEPNKLDAFPSLHTGVLIVSLLLMNKYNKKIMYYLLIPSVGILISLVYCRYHYVIDMIAGAIWAFFSYFVGMAFYDKYASKLVCSFVEKQN